MDVRGELVYAGYVVRMDIKKDKFRLGARKRTVKFEMKLEKGRGRMHAR